jgi:hypothetical protein
VTTAEGLTRGSLLEKLMAVVRPQFRADVYVPAPNDPVFIADQCAVVGCDRTSASIQRGLCTAHSLRFRRRGCPAMEDFLADPGSPVRGRRGLAACVVAGCRHGRWSRNGLCRKHSGWWDRAGRPDLASWEAPDVTPSDPASAECRLPFCDLWVGGPTKLLPWSRRPLAAARPARPRTVHRRLRAGRHRPHRYAIPGPATETGNPVRAAMPLRHALTHRASPPGHPRRSARRDTRHRLAAGADRAAMASSRCDPAQSVADVSARRARRGRGCETESAGRSNIPGTCGGWTSYPVSPRLPAAPAPEPGCGSSASPNSGCVIWANGGPGSG